MQNAKAIQLREVNQHPLIHAVYASDAPAIHLKEQREREKRGSHKPDDTDSISPCKTIITRVSCSGFNSLKFSSGAIFYLSWKCVFFDGKKTLL